MFFTLGKYYKIYVKFNENCVIKLQIIINGAVIKCKRHKSVVYLLHVHGKIKNSLSLYHYKFQFIAANFEVTVIKI